MDPDPVLAAAPARTPAPPYVRIDHVLVSDESGVAGVRFPGLAGTGHRAALADLDLRGEP